MANIRSVEKRARQAVERTRRNKSIRTSCKTQIRKAREAVASGDAAASARRFDEMSSALDKAVKRGVIHKNKAGRHKQSVQKAINALAAT